MNNQLLFAALAATLGASAATAAGLTQYVNPAVGTGDHGHVFLGANVPFGFVQLGPSQHIRGWDWCSGYNDTDSVMVGFSHTHLSGTGIGELGDVTIMPSARKPLAESRYDRSSTVTLPGYYATRLTDAAVDVELTATARSGMHRYRTVNPTDTLCITLDLAYGIGWDKRVVSDLKVDNDSTLSGLRFSKGWAKDQRIYFSAIFSRPWASVSLTDSTAVCRFAPSREPLTVKVGLSATGTDGARANLAAEIPGWDFNAVRTAADRDWNSSLSHIAIEGGNETQRRIFYTALYHSLFAPVIFNDVDGTYRGADGAVHRDTTFTPRTILSLWDTYRAANPLYLLAYPELSADLAPSFVHTAEEQGKLPVWLLHSSETDCMIGNPGIPVLANMVLAGDVADEEAAFQAMKRSAMLDERSMGLLKTHGYIPADLEPANETCAKALEYALADWCVARVAERLGHEADRKYFDDRAQTYRRYFDPATRMMRGVNFDGKFTTPFDPFHSEPAKGDYTEGNAWQYRWLVPHDVHGLIGLYGGEKPFVECLDSLFVVKGDFGDKVAPDLTGLIGQYVHGNEPSHHIIYLYNYAGMPSKAAPRLREVMETLYHDAPAGLCGNEDVGQMSAWYVLSAMGLYQVEPAGGKFIIGSPLFDKATVAVAPDRTFTVETVGNSAKNIYVQSATLNGKPYPYSYISLADMRRGGTLRLVMGAKPSKWGTARKYRP